MEFTSSEPLDSSSKLLVALIWEGTSKIQALDMFEVMQKKAAHESFLDELIPKLEALSGQKVAKIKVGMYEPIESIK